MLYIIIIIILVIIGKIHFSGSYNKAQRDIKGQVVLITGGSKGIGMEVVKELVKYEAKIIIACRSKPVELTKKYNIQYVQLDLSDIEEIKKFNKNLRQITNHIDILINNAAIMGTLTRQLTKQGYELQFGTNFIGHYYLTETLIDLIQKSNDPRIINVSSVAHLFSNFQIDDPNMNRYANSVFWSRIYTYCSYGNSKLALIILAQLIHNKHGIKTCSVHPGVCRSEIMQHQIQPLYAKILFYIIQPFFWYFTKSSHQGAQSILHCVMADIKSGHYYADCRVQPILRETKQMRQYIENINFN
ncbi:oxidation-reduction process [Paramecium bursaria]